MTLTDIANMALVDLGQDEINSIDDSSKTARIIKRRLDTIIEDVESLRDWACLLRRETFTKRGEETTTGECVFNAPRGLLRVAESASDERLWRREGSLFIAPLEELKLLCVMKETNPSYWSPFLRRAIIAKLRAAIAMPITQNAQLASQTIALADREVRDAMTEDAQQSRLRRSSRKATWLC